MNNATTMLRIVNKFNIAFGTSYPAASFPHVVDMFGGCINCTKGHVVLYPESGIDPHGLVVIPNGDKGMWIRIVRLLREEGLDEVRFIAELRMRDSKPDARPCSIGNTRWILEWIAAQLDS